MSGLVNFFKNLIAGIVGFFTGFGKKAQEEGAAIKPAKKSGNGFYLELEDAKGAAPAAKSPAPAATAVAEKPETPAAPKPEKTEVKAAGNGKPSARTAKLEAAKAAATKPSEPAKAPDPAALIAAAVASSSSKSQSNSTFAPQYLVPTNNGTRRRPGANMSTYMDMARKVGTR
ncbi:hypothetical protein ACN4EK_32010 [Pantanalinema rosaneae CENA516]|uniref:hypothetical protein n=1 Tax=Pantanalinema rosaneae TaxID=1620701 RepID=UPI003D6DD616